MYPSIRVNSGAAKYSSYCVPFLAGLPLCRSYELYVACVELVVLMLENRKTERENYALQMFVDCTDTPILQAFAQMVFLGCVWVFLFHSPTVPPFELTGFLAAELQLCTLWFAVLMTCEL